MDDAVEHYEQRWDQFGNAESLSVLVVAGASRADVIEALGVDESVPVDDEWSDDSTGWAVVEIAGGSLAIEGTGYGDPTRAALRTLSAGGRAAGVVRHNVQAHLRLGVARDGELLFDDDEFMYIEDPSIVPDELRPLFDLAWDDLDSDEEQDEEPEHDPSAVAMAIVEQVTGLRLTAEDVRAVTEAQAFRGPTLVYIDSLDD